MNSIEALLDSNVLVAALVEKHLHHGPSRSLVERAGPARFAVAAHSFAEAYSALTRRDCPEPFAFAAAEAWAGLEAVAAVTVLVGLTPAQSLAALRDFSRSGGVGPRLYDRLIGESALLHDIPTIVTWNLRHLRTLFPRLRVETPTQFLAG